MRSIFRLGEVRLGGRGPGLPRRSLSYRFRAVNLRSGGGGGRGFGLPLTELPRYAPPPTQCVRGFWKWAPSSTFFVSARGLGSGRAHYDGGRRVYADIPADLLVLLEPIVEAHGLEIVDIEVQQGRPGMLRLTIDNDAGDGRVPVDSLVGLSREVETQLDAADWMSGAYRLEVTSPGLDRALSREKDFVAVSGMGREVRVRTRRPIDGRRRFLGELVAFEEGTVRLASDGVEVAIPFAEIEKANAIYKFTSADFKGRAKKQ